LGKIAGNWKIAAGLSVACAACCAPLLLPFVLPLLAGASWAGLAGAAASGMLGASWGEVACVAILAALAGSAVFFIFRSRAQRKGATQCACASPTPEGGACAVGGDCDPDAARKVADRYAS